MTIAVTLRARTIVGALPAARGAREEDDAVRVAGDVLERLDHLGLAAARLPGERHGRPHAGVELRTEGLDELALLLGDLGIALGDEHLAVARLHAQELHPAIMAKRGRWSPGS